MHMENPFMMNPALDVENDMIYEDRLRCGNMVVGMAYVPMQMWDEIYDQCAALGRGTLFPELDKPFIGEEITVR